MTVRQRISIHLVFLWCVLVKQVYAQRPEASISGHVTGSLDVPADDADLRRMAYPSDVQSIAEELVSIPSPSGSEHAAGRYIEQWLRKRGWNVSLQFIADDEEKRFNVLALIEDVPLVDAQVILSTHFDTVPITVHNPRTSATRLYGRGAVDAKGIVAAMLAAAESLRLSGVRTVGLLFVCGEETDHAGMIEANKLEYGKDVSMINGEPTTGRLCIHQKGMLKIQLNAKGHSCHSGYPELGSSAIELLLDVIGKLRSHPWPANANGSNTTFNIGIITGGTAANIIPSSASAIILFRVITDPADVLRVVQSTADSVANVSATVITKNPPQKIYAPPRVAGEYGTFIASYNTDLSYFSHAKKKVLFGGGSILNAHIDDENILLEELIKMPEQYESIVRELLSET